MPGGVTLEQRNASRNKRGAPELKQRTCAGCQRSFVVRPDAAPACTGYDARFWCSHTCWGMSRGYGMHAK